MKILMVVTSHSSLGKSGKPTGVWLEEFASPYYAFKDAEAEVTVASPKGGRTPIDPASEVEGALTKATARLRADPAAMAALENTVTLRDVAATDFDALFYPGGHGLLWDLVEDASSIAIIEETLREGKPAAFVCHAPGVLRHVLTADGLPVVWEKDVTGFTDSEEEAAGLTAVVPFLVEDMLRQRGGRFTKEKDWTPYIVMDGMLITGQNPASSEGAAKALLEKLRFFSLAGAIKTIPWAIA